jgi:hypothetical protein
VNIKILLYVTLAFLISGCGASQPHVEKPTKKIKKVESKKHVECIKSCNIYEKKPINLFKDGFSIPLKYEPIFDKEKKHVFALSATQGSKNSSPSVSMFFQDVKWVNKILFIGSEPYEKLLKSLTKIKKDFSKIPNNGEKHYFIYYSTYKGSISAGLINKNGNKRLFLLVSGKHSVHKVVMNIGELEIDKFINSLDDLYNKIGTKYAVCAINCDQKYESGEQKKSAAQTRCESAGRYFSGDGVCY